MSNKTEAYVKNATDEKQISKARGQQKMDRDRELDDIKELMSLNSGRRFIWRLLCQCKTFGSVRCPSGSDTYYSAGQQDIGHFLLSELAQADEMILGKLMMENYKGEN